VVVKFGLAGYFYTRFFLSSYMEHYFNIAFIGAGNLAWHLAPELENYGHKVSLVCSRSKKNTKDLIQRLYNASLKRNLDFSNSDVDAIFISVNDNNIQDVVSEIIVPENCALFHSSGTQPLDILKVSAANHYGVLYPLQTFTRGVKINFRETPIFLEANGDLAYRILSDLTKGISKNIYRISSDQRSILHLSAVIASNFSNHMLTVAKSLMEDHNMDFNLLENLASTMFQKAFAIGPENGQTGPAVREDHNTLEKHLKLLKGDRDLQKLYSRISEHIIKTHRR
jgi:predicted short-subunit dehydrogenase-like oxidoreductase (DUF2520 family)